MIKDPISLGVGVLALVWAFYSYTSGQGTEEAKLPIGITVFGLIATVFGFIGFNKNPDQE